MEEEKCKVCNHSFPSTETFCPKCGFERHVLPAPVSKEVEKYENNRIRKYKELLELHRQNLEETKNKVALLTDENTKLEEGQKVLEQQIETEKRKVLKMEGDLKRALEEASKCNLSDLKGIVIISDMTHVNSSDISTYANTPINRQCLPILSGVNTYGSAIGEGNHHQITIKYRGDVFLPKHFAVDTSHSRGLVIKDMSNGKITLNGNSFEEEYAGNSKFFINQGRQLFAIEIKLLNL